MPASKYQPLAEYLAGLPRETTTVALTLPAVEALVGQELPLSAHHSSWWSNDLTRSTPRAWLAVGWRVTHAQVRQAPSAITFARVSLDNPAPAGD